MEQIHEISDHCGNMSRIKMWKIKQKVYPKYESSDPVAKVDKNGNLICDTSGLKDLYTQVYKERLSHRQIQEEYKTLKINKEYLFELRLKLSKTRISEEWNMSDIRKVLRKLKTKKATDPVGLVGRSRFGEINSHVV